jgi:hypothetical protein
VTPPWPNLFVVGAPKAGTTSLWHYLDAHPDVFMTRMKEPHFFSDYVSPVGHPVVRDEGPYLALFDDGATLRYRGDASTSYLADRRAPGAIHERVPEAQIIVSLRHPVTRAFSSYLSGVRLGIFKLPFVEQLREELAGGPSYPIVAYSLYAQSVARYRRLFAERVQVLVFEDLTADVDSTMRNVFERLDLDPAAALPDSDRHNAFVQARDPLSARLLASTRLRNAARAVVPERVRPRIEGLLVREAPVPPLPEEARQLLADVFQPDLERLQELLGRELPWRL